MTFWQMLSMTNLFKKKTSRLHHHGTVSHSLWFPNWIKCLEAWGWQAGFEKTTAHYYVNKCANSTMLIGSPAKCLYFPWWPLKFFSNIKYLFFFKKEEFWCFSFCWSACAWSSPWLTWSHGFSSQKTTCHIKLDSCQDFNFLVTGLPVNKQVFIKHLLMPSTVLSTSGNSKIYKNEGGISFEVFIVW